MNSFTWTFNLVVRDIFELPFCGFLRPKNADNEDMRRCHAISELTSIAWLINVESASAIGIPQPLGSFWSTVAPRWQSIKNWLKLLGADGASLGRGSGG